MKMDNGTFLLAAKAVWDNMPLTNTNFNPQSVNECADMLKQYVNEEKIGLSWVIGVAEAQEKSQPVFVDFRHDLNWTFLTMKSGTREQLMEELRRIDPKQMDQAMKRALREQKKVQRYDS